MSTRPLRIGVLASQGGFQAHLSTFKRLRAEPSAIRRPAELEDLDGLVVPGGESTTIGMALERDGLGEAIGEAVRGGLPLFGTCAGLILASRDHLGLINVRCERNAYGRQIASFEADVAVSGIGEEPIRAIFIRAPRVVEVGEGVEVLAEHEGDPVVIRGGNVLGVAFHPELGEDRRLHALFMAMCSERVVA